MLCDWVGELAPSDEVAQPPKPMAREIANPIAANLDILARLPCLKRGRAVDTQRISITF
jgi:hypothetical protein